MNIFYSQRNITPPTTAKWNFHQTTCNVLVWPQPTFAISQYTWSYDLTTLFKSLRLILFLLGNTLVALKLPKEIQIVWQCTVLWPVVTSKTVMQQNRIKSLLHQNGNPLELNRRCWNIPGRLHQLPAVQLVVDVSNGEIGERANTLQHKLLLLFVQLSGNKAISIKTEFNRSTMTEGGSIVSG